jgi:hypothetical protein
MPTTQKKTPLKSARANGRSSGEDNERVISRIAESLEVAQADLNKLRGSLGSGANDLRKDLSKLLRDARRDAKKMATASRKDLKRLQKDVVSAAKPPAARSRRTRAAKPAGRSSRAAR